MILNKKNLFILLCFLLYSKVTNAQFNHPFYEKAYYDIKSMLLGNKELDFKEAVFITENAWYENEISWEDFNKVISLYVSTCRGIMLSGNIIYPEKDKELALAQCAVFMFITDTIPLNIDNKIFLHMPFEYNFDDFAGKEDWTSTFVTTLIGKKMGNCRSLPMLYKIIMDDLGHDSHLALAPNHMYIKVNNKRVGWYNIELTNGDFPTDAWLMASGYIHTDAIRNGIYMKALTDKESVVLCLLDLAQGYQRKFGRGNGEFIIKCCDTALEYFPLCINAMLLKAETLTSLYMDSNDQALLDKMTDLYSTIHDLGYRKMPENMYTNWLNSMGTMTTNHRIKSLLFNNDENQY